NSSIPRSRTSGRTMTPDFDGASRVRSQVKHFARNSIGAAFHRGCRRVTMRGRRCGRWAAAGLFCAGEDLMLRLLSLFRRPRPRLNASQPKIEGLEPRQLLSGGPVLTGVHLVGSVGAVTSIVLTFNESLDPTTAQDPHAYTFGKPIPHSSESGPSLS